MAQHVAYHIAGNFRGRKLSRIGENTIFVEKTFVNSHKTAIFTKVFSLESFPLYGILSFNFKQQANSIVVCKDSKLDIACVQLQ